MENKNKRKFNARGIVTFFAFWLLIASFLFIFQTCTQAFEPPKPSVTALRGWPTVDDAQKVVNITKYQETLSSFNTVVPALIFVDGANTVQVVGAFYSNAIVPTLNNGVWSYGSSSVRSFQYSFTTGGFGLVSTTYVLNVDNYRVIAYRSSIDGELIINSGYAPDNTNALSVDAVYDSWLSFYDKVINYETNLQNAIDAATSTGYLTGVTQGRQEGYQSGYIQGKADERAIADEELREAQNQYDALMREYEYAYEHGYADGRDDTYPLAYQEGYDVGYEEGLASGGGDNGSQVIVNELDIGSIIASLPQAARNILDSTFGFDLFGINIAATLTAVLLVAIVAFVIKWLMSR